jgi:hypothetical protein
MPVLHLGVVDVPYANEGRDPPVRVTKKGRLHKGTARRLARQAQSGEGGTGAATTTVDVAKLLEKKYGLFTAFYEDNEQHIADALAHGMSGALEDLFAGAPLRDPFAEINEELTAGFKQWLAQGEVESLGIHGVPTQAAMERRSGRFKNKRGPTQRPSFIDTGIMEGSLAVWVDD